MYALAIIRYRKPLEEVQKHVDSHRAYCQGLKQEGLLLASGPLVPRTGGAMLLRVPDDDPQATLDSIRDNDPYTPVRGRAIRSVALGPGLWRGGPGPPLAAWLRLNRAAEFGGGRADSSCFAGCIARQRARSRILLRRTRAAVPGGTRLRRRHPRRKLPVARSLDLAGRLRPCRTHRVLLPPARAASRLVAAAPRHIAAGRLLPAGA